MAAPVTASSHPGAGEVPGAEPHPAHQMGADPVEYSRRDEQFAGAQQVAQPGSWCRAHRQDSKPTMATGPRAWLSIACWTDPMDGLAPDPCLPITTSSARVEYSASTWAG